MTLTFLICQYGKCFCLVSLDHVALKVIVGAKGIDKKLFKAKEEN